MKRALATSAMILLTQSPLAEVQAEEAQGGQTHEAATKEPDITDYCANFADRASDARVAWQNETLRKLEAEVDAKISLLDSKQAEIKIWIDKREAMLRLAGKELVEIYAKMDPEAAAKQLAQIDTGTATSVLRQLSPRGASAILNVMEAEEAARLVKAIANATLETGKKKEEGS
jgi:flagellar motility protein MotE (MotC chaperone)